MNLPEDADPEEKRQLAEELLDTMQDPDDKFEGVDSPSFSVRFHEWLR